ncbi:MAG: hypothetical protein ACYDA1_07005 [Vulcanimicrobiaceae bacterium]
MVRSSRVARGTFLTLLALVACGVLGFPVRAQSLARLHVESFVLSSDTATPVVEKPFHLEIVIHVKERISQLENVVLPPFVGLDILGDESTTNVAAQGTTYDERLTVVAHGSGKLEISPAYLDAIDARDGTAKRFLSNSLTLTIAGPIHAPFQKSVIFHRVSVDITVFVRIVGWLLAFACLVLVVVVLLRRRPQPLPVTVLPPAVPRPPDIPLDPRAPLRDALQRLQAEPTRAQALSARLRLREFLGIPEGATLSDALRSTNVRSATVKRALQAAERAAFVYDEGLDDAIRDFIPTLREMLT